MCQEALSRRRFLQLLGAGVLGATIESYVNPMDRTLVYADPILAATNPGKIIFVFQDGGPSECWRPIYESGFYDRYPTLSFQPEESIPLNNSGRPQGLHPALTYWKELYDNGNLSIINGVGFPNINRSHAGATEFQDTGVRSTALRDGNGLGAKLVADQGPWGGICFESGSLWARGGAGNVATGSGIADNFTENNFTYNRYQAHFEAMRNNLLAVERQFTQGNKNAKYVRDSLLQGIDNADYLVESINRPLPGDYEFPNTGFGRQCKETAALLLSELGMTAAKLRIGGWDTHANQGPRMNSLLTQLNDGLEALIKTLIAAGEWSNTLILVYGEFQNRTFENGSEGTDHGHAGPVACMSGRQMRGILGDPLYTAATRSFVEERTWDIRDIIKEGAEAFGYSTGSLFPDVNVFKPVGIFV